MFLKRIFVSFSSDARKLLTMQNTEFRSKITVQRHPPHPKTMIFLRNEDKVLKMSSGSDIYFLDSDNFTK